MTLRRLVAAMPSTRVLLLLGLAALPLANAGAPPVVGHGEAHYVNHDVAVLTADFVAYGDPLGGGTQVYFACTATQPAWGTTLACTVHLGGSSQTFYDPSPWTTGGYSGSASTTASPDDVTVCASIVGSSVPAVCARPL